MQEVQLLWSGQFERIQRDPVLSEVAAVIHITRITATGGVPGSLCPVISLLLTRLIHAQLFFRARMGDI